MLDITVREGCELQALRSTSPYFRPPIDSLLLVEC